MIDDFAALIPKEICNRSGSVFYSGRVAFSKPADLYVMGYNPGGNPSSVDESTIDFATMEMLQINDGRFSSYQDESWEGNKPGASRMQRRVLHMLRNLKHDPRETPASNLIFVRSKREDGIKKEARQLEEICWPFHEAVISQLKIKVILCLGKVTGAPVIRRVGARERIGCFMEQYPGRSWKSEAFISKNGLIVISATHPSLANWENPLADPTPLVKAMFEGSYGYSNC